MEFKSGGSDGHGSGDALVLVEPDDEPHRFVFRVTIHFENEP